MAIDLDKGLVAAILREGLDGLKAVRDSGVRIEYFKDQGKKAFAFVDDFVKQFGELPTADLIYSKFDIKLPEVQEPLGYFINEIRGRQLQLDLSSHSSTLLRLVEDGQRPFEALDELDMLIRGLRTAHDITKVQAESVPKLWPGVLDLYDRVKAGEKGVLTPWPTINNETLGFWPEDLAMFAARLGIGKCVLADTEIVNPVTGIPSTIEAVYERGDFASVLTWSKDKGVHPRKIAAKHDTGTKQCLRFDLQTGRSLGVTPEHPFLTPIGWKRADELRRGCTVGLPASIPFPIEQEPLLPEAVDLLALLLAEGSYSGNHVGISNDDEALLALAEGAAEEFGVDFKFRSGVDYDFVRRESAGRNSVLDFLRAHNMDKKKAVDKTIPDAVFQLSPEQLSRFLTIFWMCDGYVDSTGVCLGLSSKRMLKQIQHLLLRFGVQSSINYKPAKLDGRIFDSWRLRVYSHSLSCFSEHMLLWGEKERRLQEHTARERNANVGSPRVSREMMLEIKARAGAEGFRNPNGDKLRRIARKLGRKNFFPKDMFNSHGDLYAVSLASLCVYCEEFQCSEEYGWLWDSGVYWDVVGAVEDIGEQKIYDLTVEPTSCFIANDVIVHNTWAAALIAHHAWINGHKVLFGTTEISKMRIAMRFAAIHFKLPYREVRLGKLDAFNEKRFREGIKDIMDAEGLYVIGGDFDFRVESYESAIEEVEPDLSVLDGAYLLKTEGKNRTERAANAFDELKRICKRTHCPNVVTMQFNREVKANSKGSADAGKIALTDVAGWNADLCYGMIQTEDMKKDRRMIFKPLKVREGEGEEFEVNWDIDKVDFTELPKAGSAHSGGDDDPFGAGVSSDGGGSGTDDVPF